MQVFIANNEVMFINTQLRKSPFGEIFLDPNSDILIEIRKQEEEKVNFLEKIFLQKRKNTKTLSLDEAARILKVNPKFLDKFEEMYRKAGSSENDSNNLFDINAKQAAEEKEGILSNGCSQDITSYGQCFVFLKGLTVGNCNTGGQRVVNMNTREDIGRGICPVDELYQTYENIIPLENSRS